MFGERLRQPIAQDLARARVSKTTRSLNRRWRRAPACLVVLAAMCPGSALAREAAPEEAPAETADGVPSDTPPIAYRALIEEAVAESAAGRWVEARALFRAAFERFPNARAQRGIAMTSFELRDYPAAYRALRAALVDERRPLDAEQRAQAEALLSRVIRFIARYDVAVFGDEARYFVDGVERTTEPEGVLVVSAGRHTVRMSLADGRSAEGRWTVRGGEEGALPLEVAPIDPGPEPTSSTPPEPSPVSTPAPTPAETPGEPARSAALGPLGVGLVAGGGALAASGALLVGLGAADRRAVESAEAGSAFASVANEYERGPRRGRAGAALLVAGAAGAAVGIWALTARDDGPRATATLSLDRATVEVVW